MKRLGILLLVACLGGCGLVDPSAGRFFAVARASQTCNSGVLNFEREAIEELFILIEAERDAGVSQLEGLNLSMSGCGAEYGEGSAEYTACLRCATGISDEVYR